MAQKNKWMLHVASVWKKMKGKMSYRDCLKLAKKSYKKGAAAAPVEKKKRKRRVKKKRVEE